MGARTHPDRATTCPACLCHLIGRWHCMTAHLHDCCTENTLWPSSHSHVGSRTSSSRHLLRRKSPGNEQGDVIRSRQHWGYTAPRRSASGMWDRSRHSERSKRRRTTAGRALGRSAEGSRQSRGHCAQCRRIAHRQHWLVSQPHSSVNQQRPWRVSQQHPVDESKYAKAQDRRAWQRHDDQNP
jgi:hypothetical protein